MPSESASLAAALNATDAIPKRVLQLSELLAALMPVDQVCWKRVPRRNTDTAVLIGAKYFVGFLIRLGYLLFLKKYRVLLVDDLRILPLAILVAKCTGGKVIYNRQEVPTIDAARTLSTKFQLSRRWATKLAEGAESLFGRRADAILTIPVSEPDLVRLQSWGRPLYTVWNVPETATARLPSRKVRNSNAPATLIYAGSIAPENGLIAYLRLVRHLNALHEGPKTRLILVGQTWKLDRQELHQLTQQECCEDAVDHRPWVPYDELIGLLHEADIGLALADPTFEKYTHMGEGASRKVFTYMAVGLPVIAGGAFGRVVAEEGAGYFVRYDDMNALVSSAQAILLNPSAARAMGERGRQCVLSKYNWEIERAKLSRNFEAIVG